MTAESQEVQAMFEQWTLYEKVIRLNYMRHQEMILAIKNSVQKISQPLRVLDLGCGDGWMAGQGLAGGSIEDYVGIDLSESALQEAKRNLSSLGKNISLRQGNFHDVMQSQLDLKPNLILTSYSLHHFSGSELNWLLRRIGETLDPDHGLLLWVDLKCEPQESRDGYMSRVHDQFLPTWDALTGEQKDEVVNHMLQSDFPLTLQTQHELALEAGLDHPNCLYQDDFYAAHEYRRTPS